MIKPPSSPPVVFVEFPHMKVKGLSFDENDETKKSVDKDVIDLRYKHYQARLIDTINRIIE